jgi:hypothetical protein
VIAADLARTATSLVWEQMRRESWWAACVDGDSFLVGDLEMERGFLGGVFYIGYAGPLRQRQARCLASPGFQKLRRFFLLLQVDQLRGF